MLPHLQEIRERESAGPGTRRCDDEQLELIVQASQGDLRYALLLLQIAMKPGTSSDLTAISHSETATVAASALAAVRSGELHTAVRELESLMIDYGLSGTDVIAEMRPVIRREFNHPRLATALADADVRIRHGNSEFIQVGALAAELKDVLP
jgi:replication factor C small subunit